MTYSWLRTKKTYVSEEYCYQAVS